MRIASLVLYGFIAGLPPLRAKLIYLKYIRRIHVQVTVDDYLRAQHACSVCSAFERSLAGQISLLKTRRDITNLVSKNEKIQGVARAKSQCVFG